MTIIHPGRALCVLIFGLTPALAPCQRALPVAAQRIDEQRWLPDGNGAAPRDTVRDAASVNVGLGIAGGMIGGGVGLFAGGLVGAATAAGCHGEECGVGPILLGALIGESVGVGLGAHFGAGGHAKPLETTAISLGVTAAGLIAAVASQGVAAPVLLAVPIIQIAAVLGTEHE